MTPLEMGSQRGNAFFEQVALLRTLRGVRLSSPFMNNSRMQSRGAAAAGGGGPRRRRREEQLTPHRSARLHTSLWRLGTHMPYTQSTS